MNNLIFHCVTQSMIPAITFIWLPGELDVSINKNVSSSGPLGRLVTDGLDSTCETAFPSGSAFSAYISVDLGTDYHITSVYVHADSKGQLIHNTFTYSQLISIYIISTFLI